MSTASIPCITSEDRAKLTAAKLAFWPRAKTQAELDQIYAGIRKEIKATFDAKKRGPWANEP